MSIKRFMMNTAATSSTRKLVLGVCAIGRDEGRLWFKKGAFTY